nr:K(+)-transporting ATPase subunit F [Actinopolymorpha rutila]
MRCRRHPQGGGEAVSLANVVGLVLAVALIVYLLLALVKPEKF